MSIGNDDCMYERVCKERFNSIENQLRENHDSVLRIEGKVFNGLTEDMTEVKKSVRSVYRLLWGLLSAIVLSGVAVSASRLIP